MKATPLAEKNRKSGTSFRYGHLTSIVTLAVLLSSSMDVEAQPVNIEKRECSRPDVFELESGRSGSLSTSFSAPTSVSFTSVFDEPPIVICTVESTASSQIAIPITTTTTGFTAYGNADVPFNWIACTAGTFEVGKTIVQAGTAAIVGQRNTGALHAYATSKTPAIVLGTFASDDVAGSQGTYIVQGRLVGGGTTTNLNFGGRSTGISVAGDAQASGETIGFILISQTGAVRTGNNATAAGSQRLLAGQGFEAGTVYEVTSRTPSLAFQTGFGSTPRVIIGGESRDVAFNSGLGPAELAAMPTRTGFTARLSTTDSRTGYNWIAIEEGHLRVEAKRLN